MCARKRTRQQWAETSEVGQAAGSTTASGQGRVTTPGEGEEEEGTEPEEVEEQGKKSLSGEVARPPAMGTLEASVPPLTRSHIHDGATCQVHRKHKNEQMPSDQCTPGARMPATVNRIL